MLSQGGANKPQQHTNNLQTIHFAAQARIDAAEYEEIRYM